MTKKRDGTKCHEDDCIVKTAPSKVVRVYPERGPLQQFRFMESLAFRCFRCRATKKSKLITVYGGDRSKRLCNGCYGYLLSVYKIKAGTKADDAKAEQLATRLLKSVSQSDRAQAQHLYRISEERAKHLCPESLQFIATSEYVAQRLQPGSELEWSPAVIGLCKTIELEIIKQILNPLAHQASDTNFNADLIDKDIARIAKFCAKPTLKPPELGTFAHFLQTLIHSKRRRQTSALMRHFLQLAKEWSGSNWILDPAGLHKSLTLLITEFRNRAAHIDAMNKKDYAKCRELAIGSDGIVWKLVVATQHHK